MVEKYIIDKTDIRNLIIGKELDLQQGCKARAFCVEVLGKLTNGDMIKAMFPGIVVEAVKLDGEIIGYDISNLDDGTCAETYFTKSWWDAPYKKEVEE